MASTSRKASLPGVLHTLLPRAANEANTYLVAVLLLAWLRVVLLRLSLLLIPLRLHAGLTMSVQHQVVSE